MYNVTWFIQDTRLLHKTGPQNTLIICFYYAVVVHITWFWVSVLKAKYDWNLSTQMKPAFGPCCTPIYLKKDYWNVF